jgi:uncharacterized protein YjiS (DUF1127 family)
MRNPHRKRNEMTMSTFEKTTAKIPWSGLHSNLFDASFINRIRKWRAAFLKHRALRRPEAELKALDDRMLKDMGLYRCEIGSVLMEVHSARPPVPATARKRRVGR